MGAWTRTMPKAPSVFSTVMITSAQNEGFICVNVLLLKITGKHTYDEHQRIEWLWTHHYVDSYMLLFHFNPDMFLVASEETASGYVLTIAT